MNYLLLFLSVTVNAAYASLHNYLGKHKIRTAADNYTINTFTYGVGAILLLLYMALTWSRMSIFTVLFGLLFGFVTALGGVYELKALSCGPMSFTVLIATSSMILPAFSGAIVWQEEISLFKIIGTILMITAAYFTAVKDGGGTSLRWLGYCMATFLCSGSVGIMQKIQQNSVYAAENTPFLTVAFITATLVCFVFAKQSSANTEDTDQESDAFVKMRDCGTVVPAIICGAFIAFLNVVNLYLSGVLPSAFLFPIQNGGTTMLSVLCALVLFREKFSGRRGIGLVCGIAALILLML